LYFCELVTVLFTKYYSSDQIGSYGTTWTRGLYNKKNAHTDFGGKTRRQETTRMTWT